MGEADALTPAEADRLSHAQDQLGVAAFRWTSRRRIAAGSYVGLLSAPDLALEVLPKIDGLGVGETRRALVRMLHTAWNLPIHDGDLADHDLQNSSFLEILIQLFARRLRRELRQGLTHSYRHEAADLTRMRGALNATRQFGLLAGRADRLACRYEEFTSDIALNRLLLSAVHLLLRQARRSGSQRLLAEIAAHFEDVALISPAVALSTPLKLDRNNRRWAPLARLAQLFLSGRAQTTQSGKEAGVSLLFDMNRLFEAFVAAAARQALTPLGYQVRAQGPALHLAHEGERGSFLLQPDLHVTRNGRVVVLDTKWKRVDPFRRGGDVASDDAYQMHAYARAYAVDACILLYPHHDGVEAAPGLHRSWTFAKGGGRLSLGTLNVAQPASIYDLLPDLVEAACAGGAERASGFDFAAPKWGALQLVTRSGEEADDNNTPLLL